MTRRMCVAAQLLGNLYQAWEEPNIKLLQYYWS